MAKLEKDEILVKLHIDEAQTIMDIISAMMGRYIIDQNEMPSLEPAKAVYAMMALLNADKSGRLRNKLEHEAKYFMRDIADGSIWDPVKAKSRR